MMNARLLLIGTALCVLAACDSSDPPPVVTAPKAERAPAVFDPWVGTIDRARAVQNTVDDQAAAQRKRLEELER
jgi:hypothetical protein